MLIPMSEIQERWGVNPKVLTHVGAHKAEEIDWYSAAGVERVLWIEGNEALIPALRSIVSTHSGGMDNRVAHALLAAESGLQLSLNIANNGQSSSVLELEHHKVAHPEVHYTGVTECVSRTLDEVADEYGFMGTTDLVCIDAQGFEGEILKGGERLLESAQWCYLEVNLLRLYRSCVLLPELDAWLNAHGFECMELRTAGCRYHDCSDGGSPRHVGWADALWSRVADPTPVKVKWPHDWAMWYPEDAP